MIGQLIASYTFTANATVMKADNRMTRTLLDITA
jgi:flagellar basal-body rod protein FlgC